MDKEYRVTIDSLIKDELDGKAGAIAQYDAMLWKIRSGYAVIIYASIGLIAGLVNEKSVELNLHTAFAISVLIIGFSAFATFLDYSFMRSKIRVVSYRDKLTKLAYMRAKSATESKFDEENLLECLMNSGERLEDINWDQWTGFWRPPILYGGTCLVCILVAIILVK